MTNTNNTIPQEYDDTSVAGTMGQKNAIAEQIALLAKVNEVEGFNPLLFGYKKFVDVLGEHQEQLHAPVKVLQTWFRMKYPLGKIKRFTIEKGEDYCTAECRVYSGCTDNDEEFIGQGRTTVKYDPSLPDMNLESAAWTYATGKALNDAGFGIQFGYESKLYAGLPGMDAENLNKTIMQPIPSGFKPEVNTKIIEKEVTKASALDLLNASVNDAKEPVNYEEPKTIDADKNEQSKSEKSDDTTLSETDKKIMALTGLSLMSIDEARKVPCAYDKCMGKTMEQVAHESPKMLVWFVMPNTIKKFGDAGPKMAMASYILSRENIEIAAAVQRNIA